MQGSDETMDSAEKICVALPRTTSGGNGKEQKEGGRGGKVEGKSQKEHREER